MIDKSSAEAKPNMITETEQRLEDIQSMMHIGHKSIQIEKHTFFYWGIAGGLLTVLLEFLYRNAATLMTTTVYVGLCITVLGLVGYFDYRKTRKIRRSQDKSVSFIQVRMTRIWWLLIGTAILFSAGLDVYGGSAVYSIWFVLIGLAIIINASFTTQPLGYYGCALIAIGIVSPMLLPYSGLKWLAVSVFGVGVPLLGFMLYRKFGFWQANKSYAVIVWLVLSTAPGYVIYAVEKNITAPLIPSTMLSLAEYQSNPTSPAGLQIIKLPVGTIVPLKLSAQGKTIADGVFTQLPLVLNEPVEVVLENGKLNGTYRIGQGAWSTLKSWELLSFNDLYINLTSQEGFTMDVKLGILDRK